MTATSPEMIAVMIVAIIGLTEIDPANLCNKMATMVTMPKANTAFFIASKGAGEEGGFPGIFHMKNAMLVRKNASEVASGTAPEKTVFSVEDIRS